MLKTLKFFYSIAWRERRDYIVLLLISIILNVGQPFLNLIIPKFILEELVGGRRPDVLIELAACITLGNMLFMALIHIVKTNLAKCDDWFDRYLNDGISQKSMSMDFALTENPQALNQYRKASEGIAWYSGGMKGLSESVQMFFSYIFTVAGVMFIVAVKSPVLLVVAIFAVVGGSVAVWQTNKCYKIEFEVFPKVNRAFAYVTGSVLEPRYSKCIRLYHAASMMRDQFEETTKQCAKIFGYTAVKIGRWNCIGSLVNFLKNLCIYGYLGYMFLIGNINIGDFALLTGSANTLKDSLQGVLNQVQDLRKKLNFMEEYVKFINMREDTKLGSLPVDTNKIPMIEFRHVSFRYPSVKEYVLKDVNIVIPQGQHLSVVGLNGAGKTTFIKLLCRLYEVDEGEILLNGVNIKDYDYDAYMKALAVVFQDFKLFALSMRENIKLGDSEKEEQDLRSVCELSGLANKIDTLPKGLDTQIYKFFDKEGIEPSGGEMQKMAIARALYKDAPIVVLDEPTAALDPIAEHEVYSHFDKLVGGKTAIYISHRLSSCKFCDMIAVFADNTIKEYGSHEELIKKQGGFYAEMFSAQAKYYA
ncbi:ABC transporter ATP-binding protein [Anaerocolumna xylanovorans]|uniref:ATP-binding cassette, subfamily C n=1 Tax=Anaerocolumna xylanovorans DSM 12503 TaxID=1121345 RepID=A0A1M7XWX8_9FIRM|nr:ABC transporter ATP-binding protein [Anaerocolumna xylanovorans]SHO43109.1 ATP-binding cassette, subfamily C [Anaerocolumna xylanovorans DSM 12503]